MSKLLEIKNELYQNCKSTIQEKLDLLEQEASSLAESLERELKSSAGDKFETGREMIHAEFDRVKKQLTLIEKQMQVLHRINPEVENKLVSLGSLVITNRGKYFFSIAIGRVPIDSEKYFAISLASPIGMVLRDKGVGDEASFNGNKYIIEQIV